MAQSWAARSWVCEHRGALEGRAAGVGGEQTWTPDLALIGVEIILPLGLAIGDAADPAAIVPGGPVIITEEAEHPVPLQRPMATHDEAALPRLPLFLWERKLGVTEGDTEGAQRQGRGTHHLLSVRTHLVPFCSVLATEGPRRIPSTPTA